jgi:aldose 1-epimerase
MIRLGTNDLEIEISPAGACLKAARFQGEPFLKTAPNGCFPLVPFGNRVADNQFHFRDKTYRFTPNTDVDPLYLHGDGWLAQWIVAEQSATHTVLAYSHPPSIHSPYCYSTDQTITVRDNVLSLRLRLENRGEEALPFGLGFHPFFPRTPRTRLMASAQTVWSERTGHLPDASGPIPWDLDFTTSNPLPDRWLNNAFVGWNGMAEIIWPEKRMAVALSADSLFSRYMIYAPDDQKDFFCFEPMSHLPNGHNMPDLGGLIVLEPGEQISRGITLHIDETKD